MIWMSCVFAFIGWDTDQVIKQLTNTTAFYFVTVTGISSWATTMGPCEHMPTHYKTVGNILQNKLAAESKIKFVCLITKLIFRIFAVRLKTYLVEDNPTIRENLIATLEELADIEAIGMSDNENEAKLWLQDNPGLWDLAILDLFLKQGSGLGVLAACRDRQPSQKVVVLTNYATTDIRQRCTQLGVDAVFDKSNEIEALVEFCQHRSGTNKV